MSTEPKILGRQPDVLHVTPSKPNPWYGAIVEGERFTVEQLNALRRSGKDPATVETVTVKRNATDREMWWPTGSQPPQYHFECPVLGHRAGAKLAVLAPGGWSVVVHDNGWAGKTRKSFT